MSDWVRKDLETRLLVLGSSNAELSDKKLKIKEVKSLDCSASRVVSGGKVRMLFDITKVKLALEVLGVNGWLMFSEVSDSNEESEWEFSWGYQSGEKPENDQTKVDFRLAVSALRKEFTRLVEEFKKAYKDRCVGGTA